MIKNFIKCILIFLLSFFVTNQINAGCLLSKRTEEECTKLKLLKCPKETIHAWIDDNGVEKPGCVPCDSNDSISLDCISIEKARKLCPNRYISYSACSVESVKDCRFYQDKSWWKKTCTDRY